MFVSLVKLIDTYRAGRFVEKGQSRLNVRHVVLSGCSTQRHRAYRFVERAASQRPSASIVRLSDTERGGRFV